MDKSLLKIKKLFFFLSSRFLYFVFGVIIAISIYAVQAAWNTTVTDGTPLTPALWNDLVAKVAELDAAATSDHVVFINPVIVGSGGAAIAWTSFNASSYIPAGASAVILEVEAAMSGPDGGDVDAHIKVRKDGTSSAYVLLRGRAASSGDNAAWSSQGTFPVAPTGSFQYTVESPGFNGGYTVRLVGYVK